MQNIPVYSLHSFLNSNSEFTSFQIETFDANRHFQVAYPHRHDFYEILYLSKGSGIHIIDNNEYEITPPCVFFLSPGQAHKLQLSNDIEGYIFLFTSEFYSLFEFNKNKLLEFPFFFSVNQQNPPLYITEEANNIFISNLFKKAVSESIINKEGNSQIIHAILELILQICSKLYDSKLAIPTKNKSQFLVKKFLVALEENHMQNHNIEFYASLLKITPNHLTQTIKEITGKTTTQLIQEKRILEIKRLLIHTNLNITQISELMNFTDISYFTRFFKKATQISPLEYRKRELKK